MEVSVCVAGLHGRRQVEVKEEREGKSRENDHSSYSRSTHKPVEERRHFQMSLGMRLQDKEILKNVSEKAKLVMETSFPIKTCLSDSSFLFPKVSPKGFSTYIEMSVGKISIVFPHSFNVSFHF